MSSLEDKTRAQLLEFIDLLGLSKATNEKAKVFGQRKRAVLDELDSTIDGQTRLACEMQDKAYAILRARGDLLKIYNPETEEISTALTDFGIYGESEDEPTILPFKPKGPNASEQAELPPPHQGLSEVADHLANCAEAVRDAATVGNVELASELTMKTEKVIDSRFASLAKQQGELAP